MSEDIRDLSPIEPSREHQYRVRAVDPDSRGGQESFRDDFTQAEEEEARKEKDKKTAPVKDEADLLETDRVIISSAAALPLNKDVVPDGEKKVDPLVPSEEKVPEAPDKDQTPSAKSGHIDVKA